MADDEKADEPTRGQKPGDADIIIQARKRFQRCVEWESAFRPRYRDDIRFAYADDDNHWQWPDVIFDARDDADKPTITINKVRQHNLLIKNEIRQSLPGPKIKATGGGASFDSAKVYEQIIRHIEYRSNADTAKKEVNKTQVDGGLGYLRVTTDYIDDESDDQEPKIGFVRDPLSVYMDRDAKEPDGSDSMYGFEFDEQPRDEWEEKYPELKNKVGTYPAVGSDGGDWLNKDNIRIAIYYRRQPKKDKLYHYLSPDDNQVKFTKRSEFDDKPELKTKFLEFWKTVKDDYDSGVRDLQSWEVQWFKIAGDLIYERGTWHGSTIPLVKVIGEEIVIEGKLERKGHTRNLKGPQRMFNYNAAAALEYGALQTKTPWVAALDAVESNMTVWRNSNTENPALLTFNHLDISGTPLPPEALPKKPNPPTGAPLYMEGMQSADQQMMMASGQWQPQRGQEQVEASGIALNNRRKQGDNATFHFSDNLNSAMTRVYKILLEIIPKIYDTRRIVKILADDGTEQEVTIDPNAQQALVRQKAAHRDAVVKAIFNPCVGRYDVMADTGPNYATQREETWTALIEVLKTRPEYLNLIGDILFRNADFKDADEIAQRLKRIVPANVLGEGPSPEMQQLEEQCKNLQGLVVQLSEKLVTEKSKTRSADEKHTLGAYSEETKRMKVLLDALGVTPEQVRLLASQLERDALGTDIAQIVTSNADIIAAGGVKENAA